MTLYAPWVRQDLMGHALAGRKLPWFLLAGYRWDKRRDPTLVEFAVHLNRTHQRWPGWLVDATNVRRGIVGET